MSSILEVLFSSTARVQVMHLFLLSAGSQFYQREIERQTGQPIRAVQREVERLEEIGLLVRSPEGNRVFYHLNPEFPLLPELTELFRKAAAAGMPAAGRVQERPRLPEPPPDRQPFAWMETLAGASLPPSLRQRQTEGEWDRAY